jgi:hypothetical protein
MIGQWFDTFRCEELISLQQKPTRRAQRRQQRRRSVRHEPFAWRPDGVPGTADRRGPLRRALILLIILVLPAVQKKRAQVFQE